MNAIADLVDAILGLSAPRAQDLTILQVCARAAVVYVVLIAYIRLGKKRFLGQATAFDAVLIIVIGSLSSRAVSGTAPFVASLAATFVFILIHWILSYFTESSNTLSRLIKGTDTVLIKDGRTDRAALKRAHMSDDDLDEDLREQGVEDRKDVKLARLERSGKVSVIRKS
jgi:uncharacterized membrane protein YcaP (DUF421 family)